MSTSQYDYYMTKLNNLHHDMTNPDESVLEEVLEENMTEVTARKDQRPTLSNVTSIPVSIIGLVHYIFANYTLMFFRRVIKGLYFLL